VLTPRYRCWFHHDDAEREYAYDIGSEKTLQMAPERGWTVVSMKMTGSAFSPGSESMNRILLTTLILAGIGAGCYVLSWPTFRLFGILLLILGVVALVLLGLGTLVVFSRKPKPNRNNKGEET
jgi:hypothetical protein